MFTMRCRKTLHIREVNDEIYSTDYLFVIKFAFENFIIQVCWMDENKIDFCLVFMKFPSCLVIQQAGTCFEMLSGLTIHSVQCPNEESDYFSL